MGKKRARPAVGFAVKSGWATVALVAGSADAPELLDSRVIDLSDPANPDARQPYHAGFATARAAGPSLSRLIRAVEGFGAQSVAAVLREYKLAGRELGAAAIVVGSLTDPDRITNEHIRIHALEGRLFRTVVEDATRRSGLRCLVWRERDLYGLASTALEQSEPALRSALMRLGRTVTGSWRSEHKNAALAAWLALAPRAR